MLSEHKILLDFINNRFDASDLESLTPENWTTLIFEAGRHRIAPLLYSKIKLAEVESMIPTDILHKFRKKYMANTYRNTVLFHQLSELVGLLNKKNIPVILLKGAHLAEFVYKDVALRPMSDLDILVKEEHLFEAVHAAFDAGYQFFFHKSPAEKKTDNECDYDIMPDFKHFHALIHPETKCMLEIHCFITSESSNFEIQPSEIWQSAQHAALNEQPVFLLSPEDLIIHLCMHTAHDHLFEFGLGALYDISMTIKHYEQDLNWKEIQLRSSQWRASQCLMLALYFTKKCLGASIPEEIFGNFRIDKMVHIAEERIFKTSETSPMHQYYTQWRNRKGMCEKIRYVLNVLFPTRKFMASRYLKPKKSRILFSSYFFRFFQAVKGIFAIIKAVLHDSEYISRLKQGEDDLLLKEWLIKS